MTELTELEAACLSGLVETRHGYRYRPAVAAAAVEPLLAAARAEGARDMRTKIEALAASLESVGGPCTGVACPGCTAGRLRALLADGGEPQPQKVERCGIDAGSRPYWMGVDQYDPCPCVRPKGHDGEHGCADHDKPADAVGGEPQ